MYFLNFKIYKYASQDAEIAFQIVKGSVNRVFQGINS